MSNTVKLSGKNLTISQFVRVVREGATVELDNIAMEKVRSARDFVFKMTSSDVPVYGFNRGVGVNKDREIVGKYYEDYNTNLILSHTLGVEPELSEEIVRAVLLARLNTLLLGHTGIQPQIVEMYKHFLNNRIHPIIPSRGSIGEGDITNLSHIGLAMIGQGEVHYNGQRMSAHKAIEKAGMKRIVLGPKDGLAIVSSNAMSAGEGALVLKDTYDLLDIADVIYALTLEGYRGNISPLDESAYKVRPYKGQAVSADRVRKLLEGSYLWLPGVTDSLQDPLSFRGSCQINGAARDALGYVEQQMNVQLNSSDDNPCVLVEEGRMISCANYEPTTWVLGFEMLGIALNHVSKNACNRTIKLSIPKFTGLSRFLTPADTRVIAFGTIQKIFSAMDAEIRHLSNPSTVDYLSLSLDVEDHANNSPYVIRKTAKIIDNLRYIFAIEAIHAAQAIDLRKATRLGKGTKMAYELIREEIPFLDEDRNLSIDIKKAYELIKSLKLLHCK